MSKSDQFNDLLEIGQKEVTRDRWLKWKADAETTKDNRLIGYGTDIGPLAMCYRKDLFAEAGLPSDPDDVKPPFATWDSFFAAGDRFVAEVPASPGSTAPRTSSTPCTTQHDVGYFDRSDELVVESNPAIRSDGTSVTNAVAKEQSAKLVAFGNEWNTGFKLGRFATKTCPSWMLGFNETQAGPENADKWPSPTRSPTAAAAGAAPT